MNPSGWTPLAWDGLTLSVPGEWEPAGLGPGYLRLEARDGPRLILRWQQAGAGDASTVDLARPLRRLARRRGFKPDASPGEAVRQLLGGVDAAGEALPCLGPSGQPALLFQPRGTGLLALAAPLGQGEPWSAVAGSLAAADPGLFGLYDVRGQAPSGFRLLRCVLRLGHFQFLYGAKGGTLEYHRFAPAEVVLAGRSLDAWAGAAFPERADKPRLFRADMLDAFPAAFHPTREPHPGTLRRLAARWLPAARFTRLAAWLPGHSKVLAVSAAHDGRLDAETFQEVCRRYVVQAPQHENP